MASLLILGLAGCLMSSNEKAAMPLGSGMAALFFSECFSWPAGKIAGHQTDENQHEEDADT